MKKRILVISWFFPPINSSEGLVTYKLLNNSKYDYDVYTQKNNTSWSYGQSDDLIINKNINRIESSATSLDDFKVEAIKYFKDNESLYDIVMTRSMPEVSHMIGWEIKKIKSDIVWIASFGDPIGNNPFTLKSLMSENPYSLKHRSKNSMRLKEIFSPFRVIRSMRFERNKKKNYKLFIEDNNLLQKNIINSCDVIIYNSIYQKNYMLKDYVNKDELDSKSVILPHSFDDKLYLKRLHKNSKITFTYVGHLDDIRTPRELFIALKKLYDYDSKIASKIEFNFYGNLSDNDKLYLINNDLLDIVKIKKSVAYLKSLELMEEADWLVHIDANISEVVDENIFFAAKLADYIGAKKNIFGITMVNGISADILREYGSLVVENNSEEIYNYLYLIIYEDYNRKIDLNYRENYNVESIVKKFDKIIDKINKRSDIHE